MKSWSLLALGVLALGMGFYLYFGVERYTERMFELARQESRVFSDRPDLYERLKFVQQLGAKIELERRGPDWFIVSPIEDLVSDSTQEQILSALRGLEVEKRLLESEAWEKRADDLDQYGLAFPRLQVQAFPTASDTPTELHLGNRSPSGDSLYAYDPSGPALLFVNTALDFLATYDAQDYRETRLMTVDADHFELVQIQVEGEERIAFERIDRGWRMTAPYDLPLNQEYVGNQMSRLGLLRATEFLDSETELNLKEEADIRVQIGFREGVHDRRSDPSDSRYQGVDLWIHRSLKPGQSGASADDYDYFGQSDKTVPARIARFHYDNFAKDYRAYVKTSFDEFTEAEVTGISLHIFGEFSYEVGQQEGQWKQRQPDGLWSGPLEPEPVLAALRHLRNLRAEHFLDLSDAESFEAHRYEWVIGLEREEAQDMVFAIREDSGFQELALVRDNQVLIYSLRENTFDADLWEADSILKAASDEVDEQL